MRTLIARHDSCADGSIRVLAPLVGWWEDPPREGEIVGPGSRVGVVRQLNRRFALLVPEGVAGRVEGSPREREVAVAFGLRLFTLLPLGDAAPLVVGPSSGPGACAKNAGVPEGHTAVAAPTDGVYYRRPSPGAPPFVEVGSRIRAGQAVGLVEVMKTFNQILYGEPGHPPEAEVVDILCADGEEVEAGQVLMVVR